MHIILPLILQNQLQDFPKNKTKKCIIVVILHDTHKNAHIIPLETQQKLTSFKAQLL